MKKSIIFLFCLTFLFGNVDDIASESNVTNAARDLAISELKSKLAPINEKLSGNIWITRYSNYNTFQKLTAELSDIEAMLKKQSKSSSKSTIELQKKQSTIKEQLELLKEFEKAPFSSMIMAPEIEGMQKITNPIAVISGFSYIKQLRSTMDD